MRTISIIAGLLIQIFNGCNSFTKTSSFNSELIICGWDEVYILDMSIKGNVDRQKIWTWKAEDRSDIPEDFKLLFKSTDECKPFDDGRMILITSSGGGVAYMDRQEDRVLFYGRAANAHSADLLPNGRIAVSASHAPNGKGDRLIIFDIRQPDKELWSEDLPWGHGVVWDGQRKLLWALSGEDIRIYKLKDWDTAAPKLKKVSTVILPEKGGHDLYPVPDTPYLMVTTGTKCWLFDRDTKTMEPHPRIHEAARVKCISQHPVTGQIVYVQAEGENWWSERLHFLNPDDIYYLPDEHFYKARWNIRAE